MTRHTYEDRLRRVIAYVHDTPGGDLSLDTLADVAALSRFHWQRVFSSMTGESCAQMVRRVRMHKAAVLLTSTEWPIPDIASRCGYTSPQSFGRAFRDVMGHLPAEFRRIGALPPLMLHSKEGHSTMYDVTIRSSAALRLAAKPHLGPYDQVARTYDDLSAIFSARDLWAHVTGMAALYHDDPNSVAPGALRSHAGYCVGADFDMPDGLEEVRTYAGDTAVLLYKGPYTGLSKAYDYFYGTWLPASGRVPADAPSYELYLNSPMDTAPDDLRTELCVPLVPA